MQELWRANVLQKIRLVSGLILFAFALTHFLNHAIGLFSIDAMQEVQQWRWTVTRSLPGTIVLAAALVAHVVLGLHRVATRATLRLPRWELLQLLGGLLIPFLLFAHIVNTRIAHEMYGVNDIYLYELLRLWPAAAISQSLMLIFVWLHGCIGIHFWLRLNPVYRRIAPVLAALALVIPVAALGGFIVAGRNVSAIAQDQRILTAIKETAHWPSDAESEQIAGLRTIVRGEYAFLLGVTALFFAWSLYERRSVRKVTISYIGGPTITAPVGPSLLEMSRMSKVAHASVCGGRARCSTCRVRIEKGSAPLPAPTLAEAVTLRRIHAPDNVRLACQIHPEGRLVVSRLIWPGTTAPAQSTHEEERDSHGVEKALAVMVVDMRGFNRLARERPATDVISILNEFYEVAGAAIGAHGGRVEELVGDRLIAVFGEKDGLQSGCRAALKAAHAVESAVGHVNEKLGPELGRILSVGIGLDAGPLIVGRLGLGETAALSVIGRPVGVAIDIEQEAKDKGLHIMLTREVAQEASWEPEAQALSEVHSRSADGPVTVIGLAHARDIPAELLG